MAALGAVMYLGGFDISGGTGGAGGPFVGTLSITVVESNVLDPSATPSTTSDVYKIFGSRGKTLNEVTAADLVGGTTFTVGTAANFGVSQEDKGLLFMTVDAGSDYFEDSTSITSQNIGFSAAREMDIDGDNRMEYVYAVDVSSFDSAKETNVKQINIMVVQEDTSIALSSPSDQDSIGTGTKTGTIEWQITGIAEKYGGRLARIYVVSNDTTFESQCVVKSVSIAGVGTFTGSAINPVSGDKTWYIDIGVADYRELVDTIMLKHPAGGTSYVAVTVGWETYFASASDATSLTLYAQFMGADEALDAADSDACVLGG